MGVGVARTGVGVGTGMTGATRDFIVDNPMMPKRTRMIAIMVYIRMGGIAFIGLIGIGASERPHPGTRSSGSAAFGPPEIFY